MFPNRSWGLFLEVPVPNIYKKLVLGALYDFLDFQKGAFWTTLSAARAPKEHGPECWEVSWSRPCFSRNHSNYWVVGTYCFFKGRFSDGDRFIFDVFYVSLRYVLYNMSITFLQKNLVNAHPLSPQFFEKVAPHSKNCFCSDFRWSR